MPATSELCASCCVAQLAETASLGDAILGALQGQRRRLEGAAEQRKQLNADLNASSNAMQRILDRIMRRRVVWIGIAVVLIVAILATIWFQLANANEAQRTN